MTRPDIRYFLRGIMHRLSESTDILEVDIDSFDEQTGMNLENVLGMIHGGIITLEQRGIPSELITYLTHLCGAAYARGLEHENRRLKKELKEYTSYFNEADPLQGFRFPALITSR